MNETNQKNVQANQKAVEAKTVLNGQEVSVNAAQAAQEAFEAQNNQTGVQAHHDNSSEAVQAGQVAQNAAGQNMQQQKAAVKQSDLQSGQQHLAQHVQNAGGSQYQQAAKEDAAMVQKAVDAKATQQKKAD